jgi:hypothetical protein
VSTLGGISSKIRTIRASAYLKGRGRPHWLS